MQKGNFRLWLGGEQAHVGKQYSVMLNQQYDTHVH